MVDKIDFISSLGRIAVFLLMLLAVFLFTVKGQRRSSNFFLASMLLLMAVDFTGFFMESYISPKSLLLSFKMSSSLLQMPLFYFYVLNICYSDLNFKKYHLLHLLPFLIFLIFLKTENFSSKALMIFEIVGEFQWFFYITAIFLALQEHKLIYHGNFSQPDSKVFKWLFQFVIFTCIGHVFVMVKKWFYLSGNSQKIITDLNILISISALIIITWFVFKALYSPHLFTGVKTALKTTKSAFGIGRLKDVDQQVLEENIESLKTYMEEEKPFFDSELTLEKLADQVNIHQRDLSLIINHHFGKHFFDYVNDYRIKEAKKLLKNRGNKDKTVLEVLFQVGFNSKSSFYTAFKKSTGVTPTLYRRQQFMTDKK